MQTLTAAVAALLIGIALGLAVPRRPRPTREAELRRCGLEPVTNGPSLWELRRRPSAN